MSEANVRKRHSDQPEAAALRTDCIVLAAGASSRMGRPKIHLPFGSSTILGTTVRAALDAGLRVIVVGRPEDDRLCDIEGNGVVVLRNPDPSRGMISSLRVGLGRVEAENFFFIPADMPLVGPAVYAAMLASVCGSPIIPTSGGRRGHPVLMPSALIPAIMALTVGVPLKVLLEANRPLLLALDDPAVLADIDDPAAYEGFVARSLAASTNCQAR